MTCVWRIEDNPDCIIHEGERAARLAEKILRLRVSRTNLQNDKPRESLKKRYKSNPRRLTDQPPPLTRANQTVSLSS